MAKYTSSHKVSPNSRALYVSDGVIIEEGAKRNVSGKLYSYHQAKNMKFKMDLLLLCVILSPVLVKYWNQIWDFISQVYKMLF